MGIRQSDFESIPLFAGFPDEQGRVSIPDRPTRLGLAVVEYKEAAGILTKPKGFMAGYDFTINPYSGCSFACAYCYAASFAPDDQSAASWGQWVIVKENAIDLLKRSRRDLRGKSVYMSSVTTHISRSKSDWS